MRCEKVVERRFGDKMGVGHQLFDAVGDAEEREPAVEELSDSDLIGSIEDAGHIAAAGDSLEGERKTAESIGVGVLEREVRIGGEVEARELTFDASGEREREEDRCLHGRDAELSLDAAVAELDHRMDDGLRVYDRLYTVRFDTEEPVSLDNFETLIHHSSGVDRDLRAHLPVRVSESLLDRDIAEIVAGAATERAAGSGEENPIDANAVLAHKTLEDSGMFRVDGEDRDAAADSGGGDDLAGDDHSLLISESDRLVMLDSAERRPEAGKADDSSDDEIDRLHLHQVGDRVVAGEDLNFMRGESLLDQRV